MEGKGKKGERGEKGGQQMIELVFVSDAGFREEQREKRRKCVGTVMDRPVFEELN